MLPWDQRIARLLVPSLIPLNITPNQVTTASLFLGLGAGILYATGTPNLGAVLFVFSSLLDHADGDLARTTKTATRFGHYYDHIAGAICYVSLFIGIGVSLRNGELGVWCIAMGGVAGIAVSGIFTMRLVMAVEHGDEFLTQPCFAGFEIEDVLYLVAPITWFGGLLYFLVAASVGTPIFGVWQIWKYFRWVQRPSSGCRD